ncbi:MAG: hypothetical protein RBT16_00280 [Desulfococcus multivorans]|nr:hypothetical protein [Desulfococcus multivorans]
MKKWVCTVCGYIHVGDEPPDTCPVCGADKSMFEEVKEAAIDSMAPEPTIPAPSTDATTSAVNGKWECTVCGTLDDGDNPPAECPVCGADQSLFNRIGETTAGASQPGKPKIPEAPRHGGSATDPRSVDLGPEPASFKARLHHRVIAQILKHHVHPVSVHIPNGVIPFSVLFVMLAAAFDCRALEIAAQCNMIFVVLTMPIVLYSGYVEWQKRYKGFPGNRFIAKIVAAAVVTVSAVAVIVWWWIDPAVVQHKPGSFILVNLIMLFAAAVAGLIGGKLVFRD